MARHDRIQAGICALRGVLGRQRLRVGRPNCGFEHRAGQVWVAEIFLRECPTNGGGRVQHPLRPLHPRRSDEVVQQQHPARPQHARAPCQRGIHVHHVVQGVVPIDQVEELLATHRGEGIGHMEGDAVLHAGRAGRQLAIGHQRLGDLEDREVLRHPRGEQNPFLPAVGTADRDRPPKREPLAEAFTAELDKSLAHAIDVAAADEAVVVADDMAIPTT